MNTENIINRLNDIAGFIAGRLGLEQAKSFLRTIDYAITLIKMQEKERLDFISTVAKLTAENEMLKAQEAVEPIAAQDHDTPDMTVWYVCPKCKIAIDYHDAFCRHCGRALRWK